MHVCSWVFWDKCEERLVFHGTALSPGLFLGALGSGSQALSPVRCKAGIDPVPARFSMDIGVAYTTPYFLVGCEGCLILSPVDAFASVYLYLRQRAS